MTTKNRTTVLNRDNPYNRDFRETMSRDGIPARQFADIDWLKRFREQWNKWVATKNRGQAA